MEMEHGYDLSQEQRPWVSPSLIEANYILSLSRMELENIIAAEVEINPALELDEQPLCAICGAVLEGSVCPTCPVESIRPELPDRDDSLAERLTSSSSLRDDDFDPLALVADDENVRATILRDARTILKPDEQPIAEYLVDAIDERGFLAASLDEVAQALGVDAATVETVLEVVQDVAPVGVGSRDLRECLQLQIRELENLEQTVPAVVHAIVDRHLEDLALHKFGKIGKDLGVSTEEVEEARDFIRAHLNPTPLQSQLARSWRSPSRSTYVAPDVVISIKDDVLYVEVVDSGRARLRVNPLYEELAIDLGRRRVHRESEQPSPNGHSHDARPESSEDDRTHIRQYTTRAKNFLSNVQQRQDTLLRITKCICELQENFLRDGVRELRPLTRATVAQQVGVHESTVSRATADKYVMLPSRKVIPFSDFFTPSLSVKDVMRELIHQEQSQGRSLTDREICDRLQHVGIRIARRTVAKYRNELGILPSTMR
ncbi:MAG: RNA polymerase factor sigma-54 [Thermomicrobiales bacterium]